MPVPAPSPSDVVTVISTTPRLRSSVTVADVAAVWPMDTTTEVPVPVVPVPDAGPADDGNKERCESNPLIERLPGPAPRTRLVFTLLALPRLPFPASVFTRENVNASRTVAGNLRAQIVRSLADAGTPR